MSKRTKEKNRLVAEQSCADVVDRVESKVATQPYV